LHTTAGKQYALGIRSDVVYGKKDFGGSPGWRPSGFGGSPAWRPSDTPWVYAGRLTLGLLRAG